MMKTNFRVLFPDALPVHGSIDWPERPDHRLIGDLVKPYLAGEPFALVRLFDAGRMIDMIVAEMGHLRLSTRAPLALNHAATELFRDSYARLYPEDNRDHMPSIVGAAVVFERSLHP